MKRIYFILLLLCAMPFSLIYAQEMKISGIVTDASDGSPIIGATVVSSSKKGTTTDLDGHYTIAAQKGETLTFSYLGKVNKTVTVGSSMKIDVALSDNNSVLDEVVVVGYGVQKKKLVTGATVQVKGDDIQKLSTTSAFTALQSQTPGVNIIQSTGEPGQGFKVYIRGMGTNGSADPLYVIDGVSGGDVSSLNPADIESIDVLKDAASSAIYGARAANGVVLITTKHGKSGKIQVSLDSYYGVQNVYRMPQLLNAKQYMTVMDQIQFNEGGDAYDWATYLGDYYDEIENGTWKGTNWLDAIRKKNAVTQNHTINITGGNDISKFSIGVGYSSQDGIFGSPVEAKYERSTVRLNSDHVIYKVNNREVIKFGENLSYKYSVQNGIGIGNQYWNDISNMLRAMPIMPIYDSEGNYFNTDDKEAMGLDGYSDSFANPIADMVYERGYNTSKSHLLCMNTYLQIEPIKGLAFKSQFGYKMSAYDYRSYTPEYDLSSTTVNTTSSITQTGGLGWSFTWENTLNYKFDVNKNHHFDALVGQSIEKSGMGETWGATNGDLLFDGYKYAYLDNSQGVASGTTTVTGGPWDEGRLVSVFGRVNYDYKETYMASLIMRADASSNFAEGHRWGYFPSISAGWVMTNEDFMKSTSSWLDFLKLRASWGQNGNCNIDNFQYLATVSFDDTAAYSFGNSKTSQSTGAYTDIVPNPDVSWETSEQTDLGLDARLLNQRLNVAIDYYNKLTKGLLIEAPLLASYGTSAPYINGGNVRNRGIEMAFGWNDRFNKDFTYGVNLNLSYNQNKVTKISNTEGIIHGEDNVLSQGTTEMYRMQVGYPIGYFWGYKTAGVFQNADDIAAWKAAGNGIAQTNVQPGDLKFVDLNHDGSIDEDNDKTKIGDPIPHYNFGFSFTLGYKGFDLSMTTHGAFGHQIAQSYRKFGDGALENYTTDVYKSWHGEGTSNKYPRLTTGSNTNYTNISDIYIQNGDYLKCQNITVGYDFKKLFPKMVLQQARLYFTAQNLFTITGYNGMDPEIGSNAGTDDSWASGIDIGYYPSPRTYLMGLNLKF